MSLYVFVLVLLYYSIDNKHEHVLSKIRNQRRNDKEKQSTKKKERFRIYKKKTILVYND